MDQQDREPNLNREVVGALLELSHAQPSDWDGTIQHILSVDARVLGVERVSYWRAREKPSAIVCEMAYARSTGTFERGLDLEAASHADYFGAIQAGPFSAPEAVTDPRTRSLREYLETRGISSLMDFPVWVRGRFAGVLCHEHVGRPRQWSASDEQFAGTVAQVIASAVATLERTRAEGVARRATFLDQVSRSLAQAMDVEEVSRHTLSLVVPALAEGSVLNLIEEGGAIRRLGSRYTLSLEEPALAAARRRLERRAPFARMVVARRESLLAPILTDEAIVQYGILPAEADWYRQLGIQSLIGVPLLRGGRLIGTLVLVGTVRRYESEDLRLVEDLAERVAVAIENAQLHQRARAAVRARDEFIALVAHELRTPVTTLLLSTEALARRGSSASAEEVARTSRRLLSQVQRLDRLIEEMLETAAAAVKPIVLSPSPTDLAHVARHTASAFAERLERAGCTLTLRADSSVVGNWDGRRLEQMLGSLLDNASKFGAGKPVDLSVRAEGNTAILTVHDNGPGIPSGHQAHLFEAFERAVSSEHYGGLGLGLFIARAIAEAHGGELTVCSRPGAGATFTATLPVAAHPS
jgi:signal transduction histidine kinase